MDLRGCAAPDETLENPYGGARRWNGVAGRARRCLYRQSSVLPRAYDADRRRGSRRPQASALPYRGVN